MSNSIINAVREQTARLLATENITVIQCPKTQTAYFDLKNRTLALPVWKDMSNEMYDMLVGHEVSHALFTPNGAGGWVDSAKAIAANHGFAGNKEAETVAQSFLNIVEDARIERLIKDRFPGLRRDFFVAYTQFAARDIFQLKGRSVNALKFPDRLNLNFKIGFIAPVNFNAAEQVFVDRTATAVTWDEVVAIANDLFKFENDKGEEEEEDKSEGKGKGEGEGEPEKGKGRGKPEKAKPQEGEENGEAEARGESEGEADAEGEGEGEGEDREGDAETEGKPEVSNEKANDEQNRSTKQVKAGKAATADALDRASDEMRDQSGTGREYVSFPQGFKGSEFVVPYSEFLDAFRTWEKSIPNKVAYECSRAMDQSREAVDKMVADTKSSISTFAAEFERRKTADEHRRTVESKSGRLDMDQAWKYKISDNLFRTAQSMRDGKNHGFVMFIDWSGSMSPNIEQTMRQLFTLFQFCKKVGIPFDVYAFGAGVGNSTSFPSMAAKKSTKFNAALSEVQIANNVFQVLSSKMSTPELKDAFRYCLQACLRGDVWQHPFPLSLGGSTPLESAIVIAADVVKTFKEQNKLQIVNTIFLTDGEATDHVLTYTTAGNSQNWNAIKILRDGKNEFVVGKNGYNSQTGILVKWLKSKVGGNIVGIFVAENVRWASQYLNTGTDAQRLENSKNFKAHGWAAVPNGSGYDQYFVMRGEVTNTEGAMNSFESEDLSTLTPTALKNRFIKAVTNRNGSRGMIQSFVTATA